MQLITKDEYDEFNYLWKWVKVRKVILRIVLLLLLVVAVVVCGPIFVNGSKTDREITIVMCILAAAFLLPAILCAIGRSAAEQCIDTREIYVEHFTVVEKEMGIRSWRKDGQLYKKKCYFVKLKIHDKSDVVKMSVPVQQYKKIEDGKEGIAFYIGTPKLKKRRGIREKAIDDPKMQKQLEEMGIDLKLDEPSEELMPYQPDYYTFMDVD